MKILLTGASGFLGRILTQRLSELNHDVVGMGSKGQCYHVDITKPFQFEPDQHFDTVVHAAGKAHSIPKSKQEAQAFFDVNLQGTIHLCQALDQLATVPKSFIFISSVAVYGVDSGQMIDENHPLHGSTPYARSKIQAEEYLHTWAKKNDVTLSILRLPLIAGLNPPGNLGSMIRGMKTGRYLSIGSASARKSMVWAADIADYIETLSRVGGTFNLTDGYHPTLRELELQISKSLKKPTPRKIPLWAARILGKIGDLLGERSPVNSLKINKLISDLTFDDSKAAQTIGWKPTRILAQIKDII